ncbi:MAG: UDP-glucuronic acid decarboxylase 1 [Candidatus Roizmanbacteria bacterium GW2011_GWC2_37_13]|uniref:UDP-glucuronic acid decarboxylase 1 n=1 Tax=Candidatus Roizmanbacteria bacterium GW2011_GWC2_37_13 TaxID=1618486 RepID=A0A0G0GE45_9BACT|nr:MAG: UDP-glucuronic acid decarboxylase 1 [Candidatus Roizmanbacteria bacterium GW2011_GWC1_37_12]KKQ24325.1 MAG: UDP-glucuronic acid decarboxylase 1 [Candidatus Roizmanbacteria bacterium GW2011_GWC2_37_13]
MNILITGGSGFIGSHLTKHYLKNGHSVTVIDNFITGNKNNLKEIINNKSLRLIEVDLVDYNYKDLSSFDIVFDLASPASPAVFKKLSFEIFKVNSIGLINLLDFFVKSKSKTFVFASTSEVYGDPKVNPQPETYYGNVHTTGPRSSYDEGKRFAEAVIAAYISKHNIDARIARIFNTYGPYMNKEDGRFISNFINQAINNQPLTIYGDGSQTRSSCYISDMVEALAALGEKNNLKGEIINIGNPDERKVVDVANLTKQMTGSNSQISFLPIEEDDPKKRCPDITKAKKLLGWEPKIKLEEGLKTTINYFKNL